MYQKVADQKSLLVGLHAATEMMAAPNHVKIK
jgi:hypothetical protein